MDNVSRNIALLASEIEAPEEESLQVQEAADAAGALM
jgi:uncharacterized small protein (DUF1192 family)